MQNLLETLRSMKRIAPDSAYAAWSRAEILTSRQYAPRFTVAALMRGVGVVAMASLAFMGGISVVRMVFPDSSQVASGPVSGQALAAEAQTVETQLALADVQHQAVADSEEGAVSTNAASVAKSAAGAPSDGAVDRALEALSN